MATSFTESFDSTSVHELEQEKPFKTAKGLTITLLNTPGMFSFSDERCEIRSCPTKDNANKKELVLRENCQLRIAFTAQVKDLALDYRVTPAPGSVEMINDYGKHAGKDFDAATLALFPEVASLDFNVSHIYRFQDLPSGIKVRTFSEFPHEFKTLEICVIAGVALHITELRWNNA